MQLKWKWILAVQEQVLDFGLVLRSISVWDQGSIERDELSWDGPRPSLPSGRDQDEINLKCRGRGEDETRTI